MTAMTDGDHDAQVAAALRRLGRDPAGAPFASRVLAGGFSGSIVYRIDLAGEDVVLKLTPPGSHHSLLARARREAQFYRDLAALVPVRVPRALGFDWSETEGATLLLTAHAPAPPPADWTDGDFVEVARQLGQFHAAFWDRTTGPSLPDWLGAGPVLTPARCQAAARQWRALGERDDLHAALAPLRPNLERLILDLPAVERRMATTPVTLCHGDFHIENLLRGPAGEWVWADWQEVRLAPGVDDLAFFWQRAFAETDAPPPLDAMIESYVAALKTGDEAPMDRDRVDRALAWAELRLWLVEWPRYLGFLSTPRIERALHRIDTLMHRPELDRHR